MFPLPPPDLIALASPLAENISCSKCQPLSVCPFSGFITLGVIYLNDLPSVPPGFPSEVLDDSPYDAPPLCGAGGCSHRRESSSYISAIRMSFVMNVVIVPMIWGGASFGILPLLNFAPLSPWRCLRTFSSSLRSRVIIIVFFQHIVVELPG